MRELDRLFEELTLKQSDEYAAHPTWGNYKTHFKAVVYRNAEGLLHRKFGPAYICEHYGKLEWYFNGLHHREDGPAVVHKGHEQWYKHGVKHRMGGPAVYGPGTKKEWWINGVQYTLKEYTKKMQRMGICFSKK